MYQTCPVTFTPSPSPTSARELGRTRAPATIVLACLCVLASGVPHAAAQDAPDPAGDHLEGLPSSSDAGAPIDEEAPDMLQKGAWKYKIPIEVPPAPRDLKPKLEFVASHTQRDGLLGRGWNLAGFSAIERHGANGGVPEMRDTDSFWLDGLRLVVPKSATGFTDWRRTTTGFSSSTPRHRAGPPFATVGRGDGASTTEAARGPPACWSVLVRRSAGASPPSGLRTAARRATRGQAGRRRRALACRWIGEEQGGHLARGTDPGSVRQHDRLLLHGRMRLQCGGCRCERPGICLPSSAPRNLVRDLPGHLRLRAAPGQHGERA